MFTAFCESCINLRVETLECQVCQSLQPRGFPNVCLELDQFLKEQLPEEYKLRSDSVQLKLAETFKHESPTSCTFIYTCLIYQLQYYSIRDLRLVHLLCL